MASLMLQNINSKLWINRKNNTFTSMNWKVDRLDKEDVGLYKHLEEFISQEVERLLPELLDGNEKLEFILYRLGCPCFLLSQMEICCLVG